MLREPKHLCLLPILLRERSATRQARILHQDPKGACAGSLANHLYRMAQKHPQMTPTACSASWTAPRQSLRLVTPLPGSTRYSRPFMYAEQHTHLKFPCCHLCLLLVERALVVQITSLVTMQDSYVDILHAIPELPSWDYSWTFSSSNERRGAVYTLMSTLFGAGSCQAAEGQSAGCSEGCSCCSG